MDEVGLHPCIFQIPVAYPDGSLVEPRKVVEIMQPLHRQFQNLTILEPRTGIHEGVKEISHWYMIAVPKERIDALKEVVRAIGRELKQKKMYFDEGQPTVSLLDTSESA